ncbi:hypothetical protein [uncultured Sphingomonas sp.]
MLLFGPISNAGAHVAFWWTAILIGPFFVAWAVGRIFSFLRRRP